jgi:hypothetical protein
MYQVSEALDKVISGSGRTFYARLNGISEGIQEIVQTNFSTPDSYFYVGGATASKIEVSMFTKSQDFVKGTEVRLEIGATADGTIEWIPMGYFTIKEQKKDRNLLTFTAYDRLESKLAKAYKSKITNYPVESKEFLADISEQTGVEFDTSKLSDSLMIDKILTVNDQSGEKTYKEPFDGFTMQQVVGYIAQLHGTFAICDRNGKVTFRWYEVLTTDYPGKIGDTAGDYLKDQNLSFIYNTIEFLKESHTYLIKTNRYFDDLLQSETMCQISGISCDTENNHYESGTNINTNLSNPVMTQEWLDKILEKIKDTRYYPVSFSFMGDPRLDVGDVVTIVDAKNNLIDVPVMQHTIIFDGGLLSEVASYGFEEKEVKSPSEIALQRVKDDILSLQEITAKKATFNQLNAVDAKITNLQASTITVNDANILFARLDKANIQQGWITSVMIGDAQITNAKIQDMSADKLTAGTIDASIITVKNLDADSITVGKINWKQLSDDVNTTITDSKNTANNALNVANSSVQNVIIEYYSSTSKDQPVNGMWQVDSPDWVEGRYVWCRTKTVTKSGAISYSDASCITGNTGVKGDKGDQGVQGKGVKSIKGQYYLSSSKTSLVGGTWSDTQPTWTEGSYIWTRSYIVWSDDTITTTTPMLANALNTANSVANTALSTADGKNTVFYQASQPSTTGRKTNDVWYDTGNGNAMYCFDGDVWVKKVFGNNALDNISASKITTGTLDAKKVTLINLDAGSITTGTITGLDAFFNKTFKVISPTSDTEEFIISATPESVMIGTRMKSGELYLRKAMISIGDEDMAITTKGYLRLTGSQHLSLTSANDIVLFPGVSNDDKNVYINDGSTNNAILHVGNFKNLIATVENSQNSKKLSGMEIVDASKNISNAIPWIDQTGVMEIGKYLDFHEWNADTTYFSARLEVFEKSLRITAGITTALDLNGVGNASYIKFSGSGTTLGWIGLNKKDGSLMLYDSNEKEYRILDETSISFGTAEPTSNGRKGDIYIQTSDSANGWKKAVAIYYYSN